MLSGHETLILYIDIPEMTHQCEVSPVYIVHLKTNKKKKTGLPFEIMLFQQNLTKQYFKL